MIGIKDVDNDSVKMDILKYNISWYYISGLYEIITYRNILRFAKNLGKNYPVEIIIVNDNDKLSAYIYAFPNKAMHKAYLRNNSYTDFKFSDKLNTMKHES